MPLARTILVISTAFAALVASTLQGNVLCYADDGRHLAVEAPHPTAADHAHQHLHCDSVPAEEPAHGHCTDVAAEFSATREIQTRGALSLESHPGAGDLTPPPLLPATPFAAATDTTGLPARGMAGPPAPPGLACLRTIVLLV